MSRFERRLRWLDDRTMELHRIDDAIKLGRLQGQGQQMLMDGYARGFNGKPSNYPRTPEYRLQRHYEREYERVLSGRVAP